MGLMSPESSGVESISEVISLDPMYAPTGHQQMNTMQDLQGNAESVYERGMNRCDFRFCGSSEFTAIFCAHSMIES